MTPNGACQAHRLKTRRLEELRARRGMPGATVREQKRDEPGPVRVEQET